MNVDSVSLESGSESGRPQTRGQRTHERLLLAAGPLFARKGYEGTSIGDVARAAGVGVGTVYHHFRDKRALLLDLLERYEGASLLSDEPVGALGVAFEEDDVRAAVLALIRVSAELRRKHPSLYPIAQDLGRRDPEVAECCERIGRKHREWIRIGIEHGQALGRVPRDLDATASAFVLNQLFQSAISGIAEGPEIEAEPRIRALAQMVCASLLVC
jgi:AcrR family transcriptional regulator